MKPELVKLIVEALLRYGPGLARELVKLFQKQSVTVEDWEAVFAKADKPFDAYLKVPSA